MTTPPGLSALKKRELASRARNCLGRSAVEVDYYRIRQRIFFPIPVTAFPGRQSVVRGIADYPFAIWLLWELEDRILALGSNAEASGDRPSQKAAATDLYGLCQWTRFRQLGHPDLCSAHLARILVRALAWKWLARSLAKDIRFQLKNLVDDGVAHAYPIPSQRQGLKTPISNIPTIGALGLSIAATRIRHPRFNLLRKRAFALAITWLNRGLQGHAEGVSYDGYTADFIMDWAETCPAHLRRQIFNHPRLRQIIDEVAFLGAPGKPENLAPIGDVEPREMLFHYSFALKYAREHPELSFPMPRNFLAKIRSDAVPLAPTPAPQRRSGPKGIGNAHYALTLRIDTTSKAVVSWSNSTMGHMQHDAGHVIIGRKRHWIITDPGYRQYLPTAEKEFTLGPAAHNSPVINGKPPSRNLKCRRFEQGKSANAIRLDLTTTYPDWSGGVSRSVFCLRDLFVVRDTVHGKAIRSLGWHWHGNEAAAWRIHDGAASLLLEGDILRISCLGHTLEATDLQRLRGSRGQLSLTTTLRFRHPRQKVDTWWFFHFAPHSDLCHTQLVDQLSNIRWKTIDPV